MPNMDITSSFLQAISRQLDKPYGATLVLGELVLAEQLQPIIPQMLAVEDRNKPTKTAKSNSLPFTIRATPTDLPIADQSLHAIVALDFLSLFSSPESLLQDWSRLLITGGKLILVERIIQGITQRALRRLIEPARNWLAPEHLTCLLLNAGFTNIGQSWLPARQQVVVTAGSLKEL